MKNCTKCNSTKSYSEFPRDKSTSDGYRSNCKSCAYHMSIEWNRSPKGVAVRLWHKHKARSISRGHEQPDYDRDWLINYVLTHPDFESLHAAYVASDYDRMLSPSIDRLNDNIGYRKDNIRLVTFQDNMDHAYEAGRKKEHQNAGWANGAAGEHREVVQLSISGEYIARYISVSEACRQTGACDSKISSVCMGKRKTHLGSQWVYGEDYDASKVYPDLTIDKNRKTITKVAKLDDSGAVLKVYDSARDAALEHGVTHSAIQHAARGTGKSCGHQWKYINDKDQANEAAKQSMEG